MAEQWRRFREKLRLCDPIGEADDLDGSEILPIVVGETTRWIRLDKLVALARTIGRPDTPPPAAAAAIAAGTVWPTFGPLPTGWLACNGSVVSRATYARLFAVIGETHGKGNGTTTFSLPDIKTKLTTGHAPDAVWIIAL